MSATPVQTQTAVPPLGRLRGFHPGWFGAVMGTAVVGIVAYQNPGNLAGLRDTAHTFGVLTVAVSAVLAIGLGVPYVVRWLRHPEAAIADLRNVFT